jgi:methionyl-tRNA formyltransferase
MRIVYFGNHDVGCSCLETLIKQGFSPRLVVVQEKEAEHLSYGDVGEIAEKSGIEFFVYTPRHKVELRRRLKSLAPDLCISVAWRHIFGEEILEIPTKGAVNFHGSYLPRCRGANPTNWAIISGETETGVTVHFIDRGIDTGDIILQERFPILEEDTAMTVRKRQDRLSVRLMEKLTGFFPNCDFPRTKQDESNATVFRKRKPEDGSIDWESMNAREVFNFVRALTRPYPGALCSANGRRLTVWQVREATCTEKGGPGQVFVSGERPLVAARTGFVEIVDYEMEDVSNLESGILLGRV